MELNRHEYGEVFPEQWVVSLIAVITERGDRAKGATLGFIGGLMLATVCYDLLPESFEIGNMYIGFAGAVIGLILGTYLNGKVKLHCSVIRLIPHYSIIDP